MNLYLMRHADAGVPRENPVLDAKRGLVKEGKQQCMLMAGVLAGLKAQIDVIVSSPLKRARQSAQFVATEIGFEAPILTSPALAPDGDFPELQQLISEHSSREGVLFVGHNPNLLGQYLAWGSPFDANAATNAKNYGALYYMAWEPFSQSVASIANGASDSYITTFAKAVRAFGSPVAISFGHEMNGNWYPWGTTDTTAAEFVAAWRHIHDLFAAAGATNVVWIWNPNVVNPMPDVQLSPYWPGSAYVDWVGLTGYFPTTGPDTFSGIYQPTITEVRKFTSKPFIIAETSVETGPDQLASVRNLIGGVEASSDVLGFVWFNFNKDGVDWSVTDRPDVRAALASGIAGMHLASLQG